MQELQTHIRPTGAEAAATNSTHLCRSLGHKFNSPCVGALGHRFSPPVHQIQPTCAGALGHKFNQPVQKPRPQIQPTCAGASATNSTHLSRSTLSQIQPTCAPNLTHLCRSASNEGAGVHQSLQLRVHRGKVPTLSDASEQVVVSPLLLHVIPCLLGQDSDLLVTLLVTHITHLSIYVCMYTCTHNVYCETYRKCSFLLNSSLFAVVFRFSPDISLCG